MAAGQDGFLDDLLARYQQQRSALAELHQRTQQVSATTMSPRRELSGTHRHSGGVTDIRFLTSAYRPPDGTVLAHPTESAPPMDS